MTAIKERKELTKIILYTGDPVITDIDKAVIDKSLNADGKFISFGKRTLNKSNIREVEKFEVNDLDNYILSLPNALRERVKKKQKRLENNSDRTMDLNYAQNLVKNILKAQEKKDGVQQQPELTPEQKAENIRKFKNMKKTGFITK